MQCSTTTTATDVDQAEIHNEEPDENQDKLHYEIMRSISSNRPPPTYPPPSQLFRAPKTPGKNRVKQIFKKYLPHVGYINITMRTSKRTLIYFLISNLLGKVPFLKDSPVKVNFRIHNNTPIKSFEK